MLIGKYEVWEKERSKNSTLAHSSKKLLFVFFQTLIVRFFFLLERTFWEILKKNRFTASRRYRLQRKSVCFVVGNIFISLPPSVYSSRLDVLIMKPLTLRVRNCSINASNYAEFIGGMAHETS
jgi:hypothetical protein